MRPLTFSSLLFLPLFQAWSVDSTRIEMIPPVHLSFHVAQMFDQKVRCVFLDVVTGHKPLKHCQLKLFATNLAQDFEKKCQHTQTILNDYPFLKDASSLDDVFDCAQNILSQIPQLPLKGADEPPFRYSLTLKEHHAERRVSFKKWILASQRLMRLNLDGNIAIDTLEVPNLDSPVFFFPCGIVDMPAFMSKDPNLKTNTHNVFSTSLPKNVSPDQLAENSCPSFAYSGPDKGWMDVERFHTQGANRCLLAHFVPGGPNPWEIDNVRALDVRLLWPQPRPWIDDTVTSTCVKSFMKQAAETFTSPAAFVAQLSNAAFALTTPKGELPSTVDDAFKNAIGPHLKVLDKATLNTLILHIPSLHPWLEDKRKKTLPTSTEPPSTSSIFNKTVLNALAFRQEGLPPNAAFFCALPPEILVAILDTLSPIDQLSLFAAFPQINAQLSAELKPLPKFLPDFPDLKPKSFFESPKIRALSEFLPPQSTFSVEANNMAIEISCRELNRGADNCTHGRVFEANLTLRQLRHDHVKQDVLTVGPLYVLDPSHLKYYLPDAVLKDQFLSDILIRHTLVHVMHRFWQECASGDRSIDSVEAD
jgi:hypothetical protein